MLEVTSFEVDVGVSMNNSSLLSNRCGLGGPDCVSIAPHDVGPPRLLHHVMHERCSLRLPTEALPTDGTLAAGLDADRRSF